MSKISYSYSTQPELLELENRNSEYTELTKNKVFDGLEILTPYFMSYR